MSDNEKNIKNETETTKELKPQKKKFSKKEKTKKKKALRNQFLFKKGGYSVAVIALVIAALILLNWLVSTLGERFHLEYDMTIEKVNSISEENIEFLKKIKDKVSVTVCAAEDTYSSYMASYAENLYGITGATDYFDQTIDLISKYKSYNKNISIDFIDPQSSEFLEVSKEYGNSGITYGSIIVNSDKGEAKRNKILGFSDIYEIENDETYAAYGMSNSTIKGNNLESALTGAIAYCVSSKTPKVAILTGHSANDYSATLVELLKSNNFEVDVLENKSINSISNEYDSIAIISPTVDFFENELKVIDEFLQNGGKLSKGLLYFADATCPSLPNLESYLEQWGIKTGNGVLFETSQYNYSPPDPKNIFMESEKTDGENSEDGYDVVIPSVNGYVIAGNNVPFEIVKPADSSTKTNVVFRTSENTVVAPVGASTDWSDYTDNDKSKYASIIESKKSDYNSDNEKITSYVYAFSSVEYIYSDWLNYSDVFDKDIALACAENCSGAEDVGIKFVAKTITNESFAEAVTENGTKVIKLVFVWLVPVLVLAIGVYVYIKRRNA